MKKLLFIVIIFTTITAKAQEPGDTVIVELAKTSRVIFTIKDRSDLEILKHYDFQQLFEDVIQKLEDRDTTGLAGGDSTQTEIATTKDSDTDDWWETGDTSSDDDDDWDDDRDWRDHFHGNRWGRTWQSFNFDLGTNNYLADGKFPNSDNALYSVRPWGSWYLAASSIQRTRLGS